MTHLKKELYKIIVTAYTQTETKVSLGQFKYLTFSDNSPAVSVLSLRSDCGIGSFTSSSSPGHPTHIPLA